MIGRRSFSAPGIVILSLVVAGCGGPEATEGVASSPTGQPTSGATDGALPEPEVTSLRMANSAFSVGALQSFIAESEGIFEKYGLDVELVMFEGDGPAAQALAAEQIDASMLGGGPVLSATAGGEPMQTVFVTLDVPTDSLVVPEEIQSGEDLRGQQVAISTFGGDSHTAVVLALESLGLTQDDVTVTQIGGQSDRYAALQSGSVAAAPMEGIPEDELNAQGLHTLVDLAETDLRLVREGLAFRRDFIEENPNTVLAVVSAMWEAHTLMINDIDLAVRVYAEAGEVSEDEARATVEAQVPLIDPTGRATEEMFELQKEALVTTNEQIADVDPGSVFNNTFIDRLEEMGFPDAFSR